MMHADVAIVGAGPAGLALAAALSGHGLAVTVVERQAEATLADPPFDGREIALTHRSQAILRDLGAWQRLHPSEIAPLEEARVLSGHFPLAVRFVPPGSDDEPLGRLVPNHALRRTLFETVASGSAARLVAGRAVTGLSLAGTAARLTLDRGEAITAALVVAADTRFSTMREQAGIGAARVDFGRTMIVCRMQHDRPHGGVATEWFGHGQTVAMLPLQGAMSSAVLTLRPAEVGRLMAMSEDGFGAEVTRRYEARLGRMRLASTRHAYPLVAVWAHRFAVRRLALVGDAAVGMHPVTAHGFNFGLSGAATLAGRVVEAARQGRDPATAAGLAAYAAAHRRATLPLFLATNAIARLYTDDRLPARLARAALIGTGASLPPVRRAVVARLMDRPAALSAG